MKLKKVFSSFILVCSLVLGTSTQADAQTSYTVILTTSGPIPSSLDVKTGDVITFEGSIGNDVYSTTVPTGAKPFGNASLPFSDTVRVMGTYNYGDDYYSDTLGCVPTATYMGSFTDTAPATPNSPIVDFGTLNTGTTLTKNYIINPMGGNVQFSISAQITGDSSFSLGAVDFPETIWSTDSAVIPVVFSPKASGTFSGTLTIISSYNSSPISLSLQGNGKVPTTSSVQNNAQSSGLSMTVNPDPSNGTSTIMFNGSKPLDLRLALFDATGKQVHEYENIKLSSSEYSLPLSSGNLPSGEYYLRAIAGGAIVAVTKVVIAH